MCARVRVYKNECVVQIGYKGLCVIAFSALGGLCNHTTIVVACITICIEIYFIVIDIFDKFWIKLLGGSLPKEYVFESALVV